MMNTTDIDLLLIGKTGSGKSALGNAILKRPCFLSSSSYSSVTKTIDYEVSDYKGTIIKVVDGPGVGDTRLNNDGAVKLVANTMEQAIAANTRGYHAFLLVVRFGGRFTLEDQDTIDFLKNIFGKDFVRRFCILVMTCGDNFEIEAEESGTTFDHWCNEQKGVFQELLKECDHRVVLFDNVTKDEAKRDAQIDELLNVVKSLQAQGDRYTDENFALAHTAREKALKEPGKIVIREEIFHETSLILQKLQKIRQDFVGQDQVPSLKELLLQCDELISNIQHQDRGTGTLRDLENSAGFVRRSVEEAMRVQTAVAEERRRLAAEEEEMKANMEQELQRQFDKMVIQQKKTEEKMNAMKNELDKKRNELEEEKRKYREAREQDLIAQLERERELVHKQSQELQQVYQDMKEQSDNSWLETVGSVLSIAAFIARKVIFKV